MTDSSNPTFDIRHIPFSARGSWLDISPVVALHTTLEDLHLVTHQTRMHGVFRLVPERDGARVSLDYRATPSQLQWVESDRSVIDAAFESVDTVRVRGRDIELRIVDASEVLTPFTGTYLFRDPIDGAAVFTSYETGRRYRVTAITGELSIQGSEMLGEGERSVLIRSSAQAGGKGWEIAIEEFEAARHPYRPEIAFEEVAAASAREFIRFVDTIADWRTDKAPAAALAAYVLWSATVAPRGFLRRESVLMSKHWMDKVWSWDHCFNALALASGEPDLAMDQFLTPFDHQDASGALPDSVAHSEVLFNFVKPPIHGWALSRLRRDVQLDAASLAEVYAKLSSWTRYWLDFRRVPGHDLPHYQHGNDSGWDNSTTFDRDRVIESPDLAGFLLVQLDVLAALADELGSTDSSMWRRESAVVSIALLAELWDGEHFIARGAGDGQTSKTGSLLNLLPIIAADLLPRAVTDRLAAEIERHLTDFGPATQLLDSAEYEDDGYWRGPIWAPSTILIEDGLRRSGHVELADAISARFRELCERSGFAENFDARTGAGLRDRAYTWTASSYLLLAREAAAR